jgi:DNA-binding NarL/FixJ family response regulator
MTAPALAKDPSVDNRTSVLVTEASKMYCDLLSMAFSAVPDRFHVVATAFTVADILAQVREHRPSVAIISDNLSDGPLSGLRILPEVRKANPETRILLAMSSSDRELVIEAFRFGADGVFCRNRSMPSRRARSGQTRKSFATLWKSSCALPSSARSIRPSRIA